MPKIRKLAFTLIELLVVIAIIGILSGLIVVSMGGMTDKATIAKAQVFSNSLRNSLMSNLVSEWKFDVDANDSWGTHNGTITGATFNSSCVSNNCLLFNGVIGTPNGVSISGSVSELDTLSKTIGVWINPVNGGESHKTILGKFHWNGGGDQEGYDIWLNGNTLYGTVADSTRNYVHSSQSGVISSGKWFYVVMTHDNYSTIDNLKLYINGILYDKKSVSGYYPSSLTLGIGRQSGYDYHYFLGKIDEVRYYNAAMPTSQIKEQYYAGLNSLLANGNITSKDYSERINSVAER